MYVHHVCLVPVEVGRGRQTTLPPQLEQDIVSHHVDSGKQT